MSISVFDLFRIGVGPSSSHTVGPMLAAKRFVDDLRSNSQLEQTTQVIVRLYGSLSLTGVGHAIDKAIVAGLEGACPETLDVDRFSVRLSELEQSPQMLLAGLAPIVFKPSEHLVFEHTTLDFHVNGVRFYAYNAEGAVICERTFFSVGGGFIVEQDDVCINTVPDVSVTYPYASAQELLTLCETRNLRISDIVLENERAWHTDAHIDAQVDKIWHTMKACVERGLTQEGILPGGLGVRRRAKALCDQLQQTCRETGFENANTMRWLNIYAMAVSEENAGCGRMVTAPTNGAAGVIPAVLYYYQRFHKDFSHEMLKRFFLTAGAVGRLYKENASISGAEVGCQGEVGVACSMAAAGLAEILGGTPRQVENAAEIAMEHHLGLTCDPVAGLVQVPCIERNGMAAVRAINVTQLALMEDGLGKVVSLDKVIATMYQTGQDMLQQYKETAQGGLAVNVIEC